jgi:hypothetical protein
MNEPPVTNADHSFDSRKQETHYLSRLGASGSLISKFSVDATIDDACRGSSTALVRRL